MPDPTRSVQSLISAFHAGRRNVGRARGDVGRLDAPGLGLPALTSTLASVHGPLMVSGFLAR